MKHLIKHINANESFLLFMFKVSVIDIFKRKLIHLQFWPGLYIGMAKRGRSDIFFSVSI